MRATVSRCALLGLALFTADVQAQREYNSFQKVTAIDTGPREEGASYWCADVAVDANGVLYLLEATTVRKLAGGILSTVDAYFPGVGGERTQAKFVDPYGIAVDARGNIYVGCIRTLYKIAPGGATTALGEDFFQPRGIAVDSSGNAYVADSSNHVIRKISPAGNVTTFAGKMGEPGNTDGAETARFQYPSGIALDGTGNVYVADGGNFLLRKITPEGVVSTVSGIHGTRPASTQFVPATGFYAERLVFDAYGNLYVSDGVYYAIRRISPSGAVQTLTITGAYEAEIERGSPGGIAIDGRGVLYMLDYWYGTVFRTAAPPSFRQPLAGQAVSAGATVKFTAGAAGAAPLEYQWLKNGIPLAEATNDTLTIANAQSSDAANYTVRVSNAIGSAMSNSAPLSLSPPATDGLSQVSIFGGTGPGSDSLLVSFILDRGGATGAKPMLMRAVGPTLATAGVAGALGDPNLTLFSGTRAIAANENWDGNPQVTAAGERTGAFALASPTSRDAALFHAGLGTGAYTVAVAGSNDTRGVVLAEIYDATPNGSPASLAPRMLNLAARAPVGPMMDVIIGNFTLGGTTDKTLLIRAVGPTLRAFGLGDALGDPKLELFRDTELLRSNDNWGGDAAVASAAGQVGAFPLDRASRDAALLVTLAPGSYTLIVSGVANATGVALLEIYEVL